MSDEDRTENRGDVWAYLDRARSTEASGDESREWRTAFVNVGGALAYALLDLADAVREHGRG